MQNTNELLKEALKLAPKEKASFIEALMESLDTPDPALDKLWKQECESRLDAYENGNLKTVSVQEAFAKYNRSSD
jgi:putative addiction module component (TIGR02574 family)